MDATPVPPRPSGPPIDSTSTQRSVQARKKEKTTVQKSVDQQAASILERQNQSEQKKLEAQKVKIGEKEKEFALQSGIRQVISSQGQPVNATLYVASDEINERGDLEYRLKLGDKDIGSLKLHIPKDPEKKYVYVEFLGNISGGDFARVGKTLMQIAIQESFNRGFQGAIKLNADKDSPTYFYRMGFRAINTQPTYGDDQQTAMIALSEFRGHLHELEEDDENLQSAINILKKEQKKGNKPEGVIDVAYVEANWYWDPETQPMIDRNARINSLVKQGIRATARNLNGPMMLSPMDSIDEWIKLYNPPMASMPTPQRSSIGPALAVLKDQVEKKNEMASQTIPQQRQSTSKEKAQSEQKKSEAQKVQPVVEIEKKDKEFPLQSGVRQVISPQGKPVDATLYVASDETNQGRYLEYHLKVGDTVIGFVKLQIPKEPGRKYVWVEYIQNFTQGGFSRVGKTLMQVAIQESFNRGFQGAIKLDADKATPTYYYKMGFRAINNQPVYGDDQQAAMNALAEFRGNLNQLEEGDENLQKAIDILKKEQRKGNKPPGVIDIAYVEANWYWDPETQPMIDRNARIEALVKQGSKAPPRNLNGTMFLAPMASIDEWIKLYNPPVT